MSKSLSSLILFFVLLASVSADIPVHCLKHQILGLWDVNLTEPVYTNDKKVASCGHKSPDDPQDSWRSGVDNFNPTIYFQVLLNEDNTAIKIDGDQNSTGNWTMIYDEGFDIVFEGERLTNFFYYFPDSTKGYACDCGKTTIGWYRDNQSQVACWRGQKVLADGENQADLSGQQTEQKYIVQPDRLQSSSKVVSLLELQSSSSFLKKRKHHHLMAHKEESISPKKANKFTKDFTNHTEIVEWLNLIETKSWTAKAHSQFESKSLGQLNMLAGRKATTKVRTSSVSEMVTEDVSDLPKEFDWNHKLGELREQKSCGSCYAFATLQMLEARLKIKYDEDVTLSVQHALDCTFYTQGCQGGYPYLLELYASQYELVPESCSPYLGQDGKCGTCNVDSLDKIYKAENFKFIGGAYGKTTQRQMMMELMNNGPLIASFEPTNEFMYYSGGVYHSVDAEWMSSGDRPEWEKVDHSVLLYGWGETKDGLKYWKLRNTWGPDWGENGNFRIKRGVDESAVESLAESADPVIVYRNKSA